jgi:ABC-2 type transport system ATP-binding protein
MNNAMVKVHNLVKRFSSPSGEFTAVDKLSLHINEGEILGLLGRNGAGKTTTIQMLLGVMDQTEGDIFYFGKKFSEHREEILKKINFSSTYISLPWQFTVRENLEIYARLYEIPDKQKRIDKLLKEFEIDHLQKKQFTTLSAGEKTRLMITKAFLNYPRVILLDEPTASLDPEIAIKIREFLKKEKEEYNVSMLLTSHNMGEVEEMCDREMIMNHGKIIAEDTPDRLAKNISDCTLRLLIPNDVDKARKFFQKRSVSFIEKKKLFSVRVHEQEIARFLINLANENITYQEISIDKPNLEDYFLQVIGEKTYEN